MAYKSPFIEWPQARDAIMRGKRVARFAWLNSTNLEVMRQTPTWVQVLNGDALSLVTFAGRVWPWFTHSVDIAADDWYVLSAGTEPANETAQAG